MRRSLFFTVLSYISYSTYVSAQQQQQQQQSYNWSITDQSPLIDYYPVILGDPTITWNNTFSNTSTLVADPDYSTYIGKGRSSHVSEFPDATATAHFQGTAVYIWGNADQLTAVIYVDGISRNFSSGAEGVVGAVEGLTDGWHDVQVVVRGLGTVEIEGFTFTSLITSGSISNSTIDIPLVSVFGTLNVTGNWNVQYSTAQDAITGELTNYTTLSTSPDDTTSFTLYPPKNTSLIFFYGLIEQYNSEYSVSLAPISGDNAGVTARNSSFNGTSLWTSANQVLYQGTLQAGVEYEVIVTFYWNGTYTTTGFDLGSVVYVQSEGFEDGGSGGLSKGAIAGIAVGAAILLFLIILPFTPPGKRLRKQYNIFPPASHRNRAHSIVSSHSNQAGIDPYPGPPIALTDRPSSSGSEVSISKAGLGGVSPVERVGTGAVPIMSYDGSSNSARSVEGNSASSDAPLTSIVLGPEIRGDGSTLGPNAAAVSSSASASASMSVSRREKEESLALLIPHLTSGQSGTSSPNRLRTAGSTGTGTGGGGGGGSPSTLSPSSRRLLGPLRDTDSGPLTPREEEEEDVSPILPPEYDPRWARR